jgi:Sugar (and other) transporter
MLANLVTYALIMYTSSYWVTVLCLFVFGMLTSIRINVAYPYYIELTPKEARTFCSTVYILTDNSVFFFGVLYYWQVSRNWFYFVFLGFVLNAAGLIMLRFIPESPQWLLQKAKFEEAQSALQTIANFNDSQLNFKIEVFQSAKPEVSIDEIDVLSAISSPR